MESIISSSVDSAEPDIADTATDAEVTILLDGKRVSATARPGETVLETARRAGLVPPFSCEEGNCGTCMARLTGGRIEMEVNDALTDDDVAAGYILTCQALPRTAAITVEYE
ncbi:2Fe-2S iron-sulfur cluster-binding protein [Nocardia sp. NBC_00565]|uniref:2Fe-2S iron-sulfur cluster-binding protein n=1 Tax=Nocardia sp. NBC_00565 TaxID=2975993 RepID=UPI002E808120|nr:2Fe-2S iron-sulfur cluster-binding protein [Nocardia sp. NBC_00565]WUC05865.1 2Fe-2S iron-sulfur cluster-binding protein [Nocardia sp. NBC_00565]